MHSGMLGQVTSQGRNQVKFRLVQIALSYLRFRDDEALRSVNASAQRTRAEAWLMAVARNQVQSFYIANPSLMDVSMVSNHVFWAGASVAHPGMGRRARRLATEH